jgi:hypothetical protein
MFGTQRHQAHVLVPGGNARAHEERCRIHPTVLCGRPKMIPIAPHMAAFLQQRLPVERQASPGFDIPAYVAPNCSKGSVLSDVRVNM